MLSQLQNYLRYSSKSLISTFLTLWSQWTCLTPKMQQSQRVSVSTCIESAEFKLYSSLIPTVQLCGFYWRFDTFKKIGWSQQINHAYIFLCCVDTFYCKCHRRVLDCIWCHTGTFKLCKIIPKKAQMFWITFSVTL